MTRRLPGTGLFLLAWLSACGDSTGTAGLEPVLNAINGATEPIVVPGARAVLEGQGFGGEQGESVVLFTGANGPLEATIDEWTEFVIATRVPDGAASGPVRVVARGDTLAAVSVVVRSRHSFTPQQLEWKQGSPLPEPLFGLQATALAYPVSGSIRSLVLVTGGADSGSPPTRQSLIGAVDVTGRITSWTPADSVIPAPRTHHAAAAVTRASARLGTTEQGVLLEGVSYLIGGIDQSGRIVADVFGLGISSEGVQGAWTGLTPLPRALAGAIGVAGLGNLFAIGGFGTDSIAARDVFYAVIDSTGLLNGWFAGPPLPEGRAFAAATIQDDMLYLTGGETGLIDPAGAGDVLANSRASVFAIRLSARSGFFADSTWSELPVSLGRVRTRHAAFAFDSGLLITGGRYPGAPSPGETEFAAFELNGVLAPFSDVAVSTIFDLGGGAISEAASTLVVDSDGQPHPTIIGGRTEMLGAVGATWWH